MQCIKTAELPCREASCFPFTTSNYFFLGLNIKYVYKDEIICIVNLLGGYMAGGGGYTLGSGGG